MILFVYFLIAMFFFGFLTVITWNEMSLLNAMVVAGMALLWPATIVLLVIKWKDIREE